ncbi:MAG: imidazole glycerol phosphate synthase subunit HisH [Thomasclavelia sp.]|jgi:glutamine amidotransferase|nr:imidazole glycerol phosphate synthase subunit HisH [Thomasclavelia sp.]
MIVIIDYNVGNLFSVTNAFKRIGVDTIVSRDKEIIRKAKGIVLPGVGTFPVAMKNLKEFDLIDILKERKEAGVPIMGICLGMQILFEKGYEIEEVDGLGFLKGHVSYMKVDEKIPHMGWNQLHINHNNEILKYIKENQDVYFVHSYEAVINDDELVAYTDYGNHKITALAAKDNVYGCQFHPEKSGSVGRNILRAFKEIVEKC